jgi:hypothetical protein
MFRVLGVMRALHELLWLLAEARALPAAALLRGDLDAAHDATCRLADGTAARGDAGTRLPPALDRPAHWASAPVEG